MPTRRFFVVVGADVALKASSASAEQIAEHALMVEHALFREYPATRRKKHHGYPEKKPHQYPTPNTDFNSYLGGH